MATDKEIEAAANSLRNLARVSRGIPLSMIEAKEAARAALTAAEQVRASEGELPECTFAKCPTPEQCRGSKTCGNISPQTVAPGDRNDGYAWREAMSWLRDHDPQLVDAALEKFKLCL